MTDSPQQAKDRKFIRRLITGVIFNVASFGSALFLPAGTFAWWRAWVLLAVIFVATVATMLWVFRTREELLNERVKPIIQRGQPLWDKIILMLFLATYVGQIVFIPLDVFHFHLLRPPPVLVSSFGLILMVAGWMLVSLAFRENTFAAPVVKHQKERQQRVVDTGVYGLVRHPLYTGVVLQTIGMPLWLESYAGTLLAIIPCGVLALRIVFEERFLRRELPGYEAYTKVVRYRLVPFLW